MKILTILGVKSHGAMTCQMIEKIEKVVLLAIFIRRF